MVTIRKLITGLLMAILCVTLIALATVTLKGNIASASNDDSSDYGIATVASTCTHTWDHSTAAAVNPASNINVTSGGTKSSPKTYYLNNDVTLKEDIVLTTGYIELCLNGHTLTGTGTSSVIKVGQSSNFTTSFKLHDSNAGGGKITGGNASSAGGGISADFGSTVEMYGGAITGNTAKNGGGGVYVRTTFTMYNGSISDNTSVLCSGGGVYVVGTFEMRNGTISGNTAQDDDNEFNLKQYGGGGGLQISKSGTFTMKGGTVTGNKAGYLGGGVMNRGTIKVSGTATITNNTNLTSGATDNVYLNNNSVISIAAALKEGAQFGITAPNEDSVFTSGYNTYNSKDDPYQFFFNDSDSSATICRQDGELIFAEHVPTGAWTFKDEGSATAPRTQSSHCSTCDEDVVRELELLSITVDALKSYTAGQLLQINSVTANFKLKGGANTSIDSCELDSDQYTVSAYANGNSLTPKDKSFTVSYTVGGVTKSYAFSVTVESVQENDSPLGTYTRAAWHEGQAPSDVTFAGFQSGLSYQLEYYKDQQLNTKYTGNMDQTAPAGTYYVKATTAGNDNYYPYSGCIGSFTISAHDWDNDWQVTAGEHYKECNYFGCAVEQRASHTTNDSNYKSVANHGDEGHWLTCNVCSEKYNQETHNWDGMQWQQDVSYHYKKCEVCEQEKTENHNTSGSAYTDNSNEDYHWLVCKVCSAEVNKNSHSWNGIWKAKGDKHYQECDVCYAQDLQDHNTSGSTYQDANNHNESGHWLICRTCRAEVEKVTHDWSEIQYISDGKTQHHQECPVCAESKASEAHSIANYTLVDNDFHKGNCELCSEQDIKESHVANADYKASENHDMNGHWLRCNVCNEKYSEVAHAWDGEWLVGEDNHYRQCEICEQVKAEDHSWGDWTASEDKHVRVCDKCAASEAEDHVWNDGVVTSDATASEDGVRTYTCEKCGATKTEPIPATGEVEVPNDDPSDAPVKDPSNSNPSTDEPEEKKIDLVVVIAIAVGAVMLIAAAVAIIVKKKNNASNA